MLITKYCSGITISYSGESDAMGKQRQKSRKMNRIIVKRQSDVTGYQASCMTLDNQKNGNTSVTDIQITSDVLAKIRLYGCYV